MSTTTATRNRKSSRSREERAEQVAALVAQVAEQVEQLGEPGQWQAMLATAANLWKYSLRNQLLIRSQTEERGFVPTRVNGYKAWQALGRQVTKGEKGLQILAPAGELLVEADQEESGENVVELEDGTRKRRIRRFRPIHVWDISQTHDPFDPEAGLPANALRTAEQERQVRADLEARIAAHGYSLTYGRTRRPDVHGITSHTDRTVIVGEHIDERGQLLTLAHELAHIALDHGTQDYGRDRGRMEIEAESVAYVLLGALGVDLTGASIDSLEYMQGWADLDADLVRATADTVTRTAKTELDVILGAEQDTDTEIQS